MEDWKHDLRDNQFLTKPADSSSLMWWIDNWLSHKCDIIAYMPICVGSTNYVSSSVKMICWWHCYDVPFQFNTKTDISIIRSMSTEKHQKNKSRHSPCRKRTLQLRSNCHESITGKASFSVWTAITEKWRLAQHIWYKRSLLFLFIKYTAHFLTHSLGNSVISSFVVFLLSPPSIYLTTLLEIAKPFESVCLSLYSTFAIWAICSGILRI